MSVTIVPTAVAPTAAPLEALMDALGQAIVDAEDAFRRRFRIAAEVDLPPHGRLGYLEKAGQYQLMVWLQVGDAAAPPIALVGLSVAVHVRAADHLDALWNACEKVDQESAESILRAIATIRQRFPVRTESNDPSSDR